MEEWHATFTLEPLNDDKIVPGYITQLCITQTMVNGDAGRRCYQVNKYI